MSQDIEDARKRWPGDSSNFMVGSKQVDSKKKWQPKSDYDKGGRYGKVKGFTLRSGQSVEIDETPGAERIRVINTDGSYIEMQSNGDTVRRVQGSDYEVVLKEKNVRIKGATNVHIDGDANVKVGGNADVESGGDFTVTSGGTYTVSARDVVFKSGSVSHDGIDIGKTHTHGGILPGGSDTDTPNPL